MFQTTNKSCKRNGICIGWFKNMTQENHGKSTNEHEWTITCKVSGKTFNVHHRSSWTTNSANLAPKTESETMFGPQKLTSEICCAESRGSRGFLFLLKKTRPNIPASDKTCLAAALCYDNPTIISVSLPWPSWGIGQDWEQEQLCRDSCCCSSREDQTQLLLVVTFAANRSAVLIGKLQLEVNSPQRHLDSLRN